MSPFAGSGSTKARAMHPPPDIMRHFPSLEQCVSHFLGNRGGFSGALLWRLDSAAGAFCLKAWPEDDPTQERLTWIHELLDQARRRGVDFVPQVLRTSAGRTVIEHAGRLWDVSTWLPGEADFHANPSTARLQAAGSALARLHTAWQSAAPRTGPCPVVRRRLETLRRWRELVACGWRPAPAADDPVGAAADRAWQLLPQRLPETERLLQPWLDIPLPLHPCWCDPWHDHVLFSGDRLSGLIDYGSVKEDHAAVDLARLLGSLAGDDYAAWEIVLAAYRAIRPLTDQEQILVAVLERAGAINALATWLRWLYAERRLFEDRGAVAKRLQIIVAHVDNQPSKIHQHGEPGE